MGLSFERSLVLQPLRLATGGVLDFVLGETMEGLCGFFIFPQEGTVPWETAHS